MLIILHYLQTIYFYKLHSFEFSVGLVLLHFYYSDLSNITAEQMEFPTHVVLYHRLLKT